MNQIVDNEYRFKEETIHKMTNIQKQMEYHIITIYIKEKN